MPGLHPDLLALLAACRAAPADDTPRLVLADWLEEHAAASGLPSAAAAHARAALIRVQVELARATADVARAAELRAAEHTLLATHAHEWVGELPNILRELRGHQPQLLQGFPPQTPFPDRAGYGRAWGFRRGLLWGNLSLHELSHEPLRAWFASDLAPWLEEAVVDLSDARSLARPAVPDELRPYLGVRYRVGIPQVMTLQNPRGDTGRVSARACRELLRSANFGLVRELHVGAPAVEAGILRMMAGADVTRLRVLDLTGAGLDDDRAAELAAAPLENLSALNVAANQVRADGMRALAASAHLRRLVSLTAWRNRIGDAGLMALAGSPLAESLTTLLIQNNGVGDRGIEALAASPLMARLNGPGLNLSMNGIADDGAVALAQCPHQARFSELILRENAVGDAGAEALANSLHAANLTYLDLWKNRVGDRGAAELAASPHLGRVRDLNLRENRIGDWGAELLRSRFGDRVRV